MSGARRCAAAGLLVPCMTLACPGSQNDVAESRYVVPPPESHQVVPVPLSIDGRYAHLQQTLTSSWRTYDAASRTAHDVPGTSHHWGTRRRWPARSRHCPCLGLLGLDSPEMAPHFATGGTGRTHDPLGTTRDGSLEHPIQRSTGEAPADPGSASRLGTRDDPGEPADRSRLERAASTQPRAGRSLPQAGRADPALPAAHGFA